MRKRGLWAMAGFGPAKSRPTPIELIAAGCIALVILAGARSTDSSGLDTDSSGYMSSRSSKAPNASTWTDHRCGTCHSFDAMLSHPVDITPSMAVPDDLPLIDGRLTCITCHDNSSAAAHRSARSGGSALLRRDMEGESFCTACHDASGIDRRDMHGANLGRAHLAQADVAALWGQPERPDSETDLPPSAASERCLGCHDGSVSSSVSHDFGRGRRRGIGSSSLTTGGHPIGMSYPVARRDPGGGSGYTPAEQLDRRLRLINGRVECLTCHSPFSPNKGLLVMPNTRSDLCLSCHEF